eukprot:CAMPEP_0117559324 /NCGR_PEP_ID=MMETSP0784-20121206/53299_1 /TAXON_ID=39447 /ORGANISM="" /LENGTH=56 /DNA_ID=CAMNT_0005356693 /DNA_START=63 /DNA_END=230 /DNA_ORIENTATION=-
MPLGTRRAPGALCKCRAVHWHIASFAVCRRSKDGSTDKHVEAIASVAEASASGNVK